MLTFQQILQQINEFWAKQGCIIQQGYDLEVGAGTFNPATFLRCLGPEPYRAAYVEPCRRPSDGRYGQNPNRLQHYFQYQVILKPSPDNIQDLYLASLENLGFKLDQHDIRFVHDDWENPTIGAWGLGWEVWMDGMEVTQFTYFQSVGGVELKPITGEITYGIERLAMYLQNVNSIFDIKWNDTLTYGDIYQRNEVEWSNYNFQYASTEMWARHFEDYENEAKRMIAANLPIPAYDFVMKASHAFNMLDARGVISVTERTGYIGRIRDLARMIAESYIKSREAMGHPLLGHAKLRPSTAKAPHKEESLVDVLADVHSDDTEDFLLEIGSEELPASFVPIGSQNLERSLRQLLQKEEIAYESIRSYATPRRLAIYIKQLAKGKAAKTTERRGPSIEQAYQPNGALKPAGEGFFRSLGIPAPQLDAIKQGKISGIEIRKEKDSSYLYGSTFVEGRATAAILAEQLPHLILSLEFPKKMRWGDLDITFARPLRWIVALQGDRVIPFQVGPLTSGRHSEGHRQLAPGCFPIEKANQYLTELRKHSVLADPAERQQMIQDQIGQLQNHSQVKIIEQEKVLPQVVNLVEWPHLTFGTFQQHFLKAPKEILISEMVEHQKYFPVSNKDGTLRNLFVVTANVQPTDKIREGNQRVLSARLSDGVFLYEEDLKASLDHFNEKLKKITFQKELGTVYQKVERINKHAKAIQAMLAISTPEKVSRAAHLCKADLASALVYEFPELQGIAGRYYATAKNEDHEVAAAIEEHWMPRGENSPLPATQTGIVLSLAEKFDNLIGCFCVGLKPTSSSDPYALRRQVLGIIKMLINNKLSLHLQECLEACVNQFPRDKVKDKLALIDDILAFITNRVKTVFVDYGFHKDEIEASLSQGCADIYDTFCRVKALHEFRQRAPEQFGSLFEVFKRSKGQLGDAKKSTVVESLLVEPAEKKLFSMLESKQSAYEKALAEKQYDTAYALIADLQPALADLFDQVKILADDASVRNNRLALLHRVFDLFGRLLDFTKIQETAGFVKK